MSISRYPFTQPEVCQQLWHSVDATGWHVGSLAAKIVPILCGKHKPIYNPSVIESGDFVVVTNATQLKFTGTKWKNKEYKYHTGWVGHLKVIPASKVAKEHPDRILISAVWGMLPKNKLRERRLSMLKVFAGPEHNHHAQINGVGCDSVIGDPPAYKNTEQEIVGGPDQPGFYLKMGRNEEGNITFEEWDQGTPEQIAQLNHEEKVDKLRRKANRYKIPRPAKTFREYNNLDLKELQRETDKMLTENPLGFMEQMTTVPKVENPNKKKK